MTNNAIEISDLSFAYKHNSKKFLQHINLSVQEGSWLSIIGRNGSGKTTLIKLILGLAAGQISGRIDFFDQTINENNIDSIRDQIGVVFQNPENQFVAATVADDVAFGLENHGVSRDQMIKKVRSALIEVGIADLADREPESLSGGQKQRVALASVIALRPRMIILDEATSMLDPNGRQELLNIIRKLQSAYKITIIAITHHIAEVQQADQVIVIDQGKKVLEGKPADVLIQDDKLTSFGLEVPFTRRIRKDLADLGLLLPDSYASSESMVTQIWRSYSKM